MKMARLFKFVLWLLAANQITAALAQDLSVEKDEAEQLKINS